MSKLNWGHGIFAFYVGFVIAVVTALIASMQVDHPLVTESYYAADLAYQETYEQKQRALAEDRIDIRLDRESQQLLVDLHDEPKTGKISFYRDSDHSQDFYIDVAKTSSAVSVDHLVRGKWQVHVLYESAGKTYLATEDIYL